MKRKLLESSKEVPTMDEKEKLPQAVAGSSPQETGERQAKEEKAAARQQERSRVDNTPKTFASFSSPSFLNQKAPKAQTAPMTLQQPKVQSTVERKDIQIPDFLKNRSH